MQDNNITKVYVITLSDLKDTTIWEFVSYQIFDYTCRYIRNIPLKSLSLEAVPFKYAISNVIFLTNIILNMWQSTHSLGICQNVHNSNNYHGFFFHVHKSFPKLLKFLDEAANNSCLWYSGVWVCVCVSLAFRHCPKYIWFINR